MLNKILTILHLLILWGFAIGDGSTMGTKNSTPRASNKSHTEASYQSNAESYASPRNSKISSTHGSCGPTESTLEAATGQHHRHPTLTHKESLIDQKVTEALQKRWRSYVVNKNKIPFTRILLKFPQAANAFNGVRTIFKTFDKENLGYIVCEDLPAFFTNIGVCFTEQEISQVFEEADLEENGRLSFKELLVCLAIGFLLHRFPTLEKNRLSVFYTPRGNIGVNDSAGRTSSNSVGGSNCTSVVLSGDDNELRAAFQLAVDAFLWFDTDGSGYINRNNMTVQLETSMARHSPMKKLKNRSGCYKDSGEVSTNWSIWDRRFAEMDWSHNGTIHFNEFLMAFESWVGVDDEDDDEDIEETEKETSSAVESTA